MSQLVVSEGQPGNWEEPNFFLRRLETMRFQENGWQERYDGRSSRTVLRGPGGEIPLGYSTLYSGYNWDTVKRSQVYKNDIYGISIIDPHDLHAFMVSQLLGLAEHLIPARVLMARFNMYAIYFPWAKKIRNWHFRFNLILKLVIAKINCPYRRAGS